MMLQLNPAIPLETPRGKGFAHFIIDYSQEHDLIWVVFIGNPEIRLQKNMTFGRMNNPKI
jgi:hypothetical protein